MWLCSNKMLHTEEHSVLNLAVGCSLPPPDINVQTLNGSVLWTLPVYWSWREQWWFDTSYPAGLWCQGQGCFEAVLTMCRGHPGSCASFSICTASQQLFQSQGCPCVSDFSVLVTLLGVLGSCWEGMVWCSRWELEIESLHVRQTPRWHWGSRTLSGRNICSYNKDDYWGINFQLVFLILKWFPVIHYRHVHARSLLSMINGMTWLLSFR